MVDEGKAVIPLNISVVGDITVVTYHARSTFGGKVQGKVGQYIGQELRLVRR